MIRLTVLYNLPDGTDEEEFLRWRLGEHQDSNSSMAGVLRTDFARIEKSWPDDVKSPYRFKTEVEFPDRETFEKSFYDPDVQAKLKEDVKRISDMTFLISEVLTETIN